MSLDHTVEEPEALTTFRQIHNSSVTLKLSRHLGSHLRLAWGGHLEWFFHTMPAADFSALLRVEISHGKSFLFQLVLQDLPPSVTVDGWASPSNAGLPL